MPPSTKCECEEIHPSLTSKSLIALDNKAGKYSGETWTLAYFPELLSFWGTGKTKKGLKFERSEILTGVSNYCHLSVQNVHSISYTIFTTEALNNNVIKGLRIGIRGDGELGVCSSKVVNIPNIAFFPAKKIIASRKLSP